MQTDRIPAPKSKPNRRQRRLTVYRIIVLAGVVALVAMGVVQQFRPSAATVHITTTNARVSKTAEAASFLQDVGFNDPVYLGITQGTEGEYPTFQATAIGGKSVKLWIRTTPSGGWEIQPIMMFETVASADDFARKADAAVFDWQNMPKTIKPRTDGAAGEYETREYDYDNLGPYAPGASYWQTRPDETRDWPRK